MALPIRLNKYLSEVGYCSRRAADKLIEAGDVTVNDTLAQMGTKINENDVVKVKGEEVKQLKKKFVYIAFHKPIGVVCTTNTKVEKNNIIDFINYPKRIFPIGRLDKLSEGLILLTDDGDIVNKILRASNKHEKEYIVTVDKPLSQTFIERMSLGVYINELQQKTKPCVVKKIDAYTFSIILTQGLNRQIRRMCNYFNYNVTTLKRIRIMNINLDISVGTYRELTPKEFEDLSKLLTNSTKTNYTNKNNLK